jgi:Uma2 family endonuclease
MAHASRMRVLALDSTLPQIQDLLRSRQRSGIDRFDEVWDGVLHLSPNPSYQHARISQRLAEILGPLAQAAGLEASAGGFNLGESEQNYRIPDAGVHLPGTDGLYVPTAKLVVEIRSLDDESWEKLPFYAARGVDEVIILEPDGHAIYWFALINVDYVAVGYSRLIDLGPDELSACLDWD